MKKFLTVFLLLAVLVSSCSDDKDLINEQKSSGAQKVISFIDKAKSQNLSQEQINTQLHAYIIQLGGKIIPAEESESIELSAAKADECVLGKWTNYDLGGGDSVGVLSFTKCQLLCPGSGNGYQISQWTLNAAGTKYDVKYTTVCMPATAS